MKRAFDPFGCERVAFGKLRGKIANQIKLIRVAGQIRLQVSGGLKFVEESQHLVGDAGSLQGIFQRLAGTAFILALVDVIEVSGTGFVQIMEEAQQRDTGGINPGQAGQDIAYHRDAIAVFSHIFFACAQKSVPAARDVTQHTDFI